jgi:hypothetical protein
MQNKLRYFKVYRLNSKLVEFGRVKISKESGKPLDAAKKLLNSICLHEKISNKLKCKVQFYIKETTKGSNKKIYGPYKGLFKKYEKPVIVELKDGSKIKHSVYPYVYKLKSKSIIQKGGQNSFNINNIIKLLKFTDYYNKKNIGYAQILIYKKLQIILEQTTNISLIDLYKLLEICIKENRLYVVELLINKSKNGKDSIFEYKDQTPLLIIAIEKNNYEAVELLLKNGANVNIQDKFGNTALTILLKNTYTTNNI